MNKINHIAIIMDRNGRWGKKRGKTRNFGHTQGIKVIEKIVKESLRINIPVLTFYTFSTENWRRPKTEVNFLFNLINKYFLKEIKNIIKNDIKINIIGITNGLPKSQKVSLLKCMKKTKKCKKILVNLAINYGAKNEIINAFKKLKENKIKPSIKNLEKYLYTKNMPEPDFLIRTGGKRRLSNFLLWQMAYSELYFVDKLWPDFKISDFKRILNNFKRVKRNFGKV